MDFSTSNRAFTVYSSISHALGWCIFLYLDIVLDRVVIAVREGVSDPFSTHLG